MTRIFHGFFCERWIQCQALTSVLCLHFHPEIVHCSTKDAYPSELTFLCIITLVHCILLLQFQSPYYKFETSLKLYAVHGDSETER